MDGLMLELLAHLVSELQSHIVVYECPFDYHRCIIDNNREELNETAAISIVQLSNRKIAT